MTLLSKVAALGCPFHGLIRDGAIALPSDKTVAYPQPLDGVGPDLGETYLQRLPWAPADYRTPEQIVDDVMRGRQWADYAILSGAAQQLHGRELEGWIYAAPDGRPWRISRGPLGSYSGGATFSESFTASLFGRFGAEPVSHSATGSLAATGQATPDLPGFAIRARLADILPDGSQAIVMIYAQGGADYGLGYQPVGFWLLTLTGTPGIDFAITIEVLADREETLGEVEDTGKIPAPTLSYYRNEPPFNGDVTVTDQVGAPPTCSGYVDLITTPGIMQDLAGSGDEADGFGVEVITATRTRTLTGRIVSYWFVDGLPVPVTATVSERWGIDAPAIDQSVSGQYVIRRDLTGAVVGGVCQISNSQTTLERYTRRYGRTVSTWEAVDITLQGVGSPMTWSILSEEDVTYSIELLNELDPVIENNISLRLTTPLGSFEESFPLSPDSGSWSSGTASDPFAEGLTPVQQMLRTEATAPVYLSDHAAQLSVLRYSNNLLAVLLRHGPGNLDSWTVPGALTPAGVEAGQKTGTNANRFGSYNPATTEAVWHKPDPVCWT